MAIVLQDSFLENELLKLSTKLHIKVDELLKKILKEQISNLNIDTSHIDIVDDDEKDEILKIISTQNDDIDETATKVIKIWH